MGRFTTDDQQTLLTYICRYRDFFRLNVSDIAFLFDRYSTCYCFKSYYILIIYYGLLSGLSRFSVQGGTNSIP